MTSIYEKGFTKNVFQQLDTDSSLCVLGLCLASHDIAFHSTLSSNSEPEEGSYHFAASLSILREVAKIIGRVDKLAFTTYFSQETKNLLKDLIGDLQPFHNGSLAKGTLKPIRDVTFHYDFPEANQNINSLLAEIKKEPKLPVRARSDDHSILRHRYTFADAFRGKLIDSYLTKDIVDQISVATVNVMTFTDSLMTDLSS
jgi:hypothetical protein